MDVSKKITDLWLSCFDDIDKSFVKSFYGSFECEGNIIITHVRDGELRITRGMQNAVKPVGIVNRVPCQLHIGKDTVNGYYLYGCCVAEEWRGKGVFKALIENANCDCDFTVLVPENDGLYEMYRKLGYVDTAGSVFPFECDISNINGLSLTPAGEDYSALNSLDAARNEDGFTFGGLFNAFIMKTLRRKEFCYIEKDGGTDGYIIYEKITDDKIKVLDMYSKSDIADNIIAHSGAVSKPKSMIRVSGRGYSGYPAMNRCGEY